MQTIWPQSTHFNTRGANLILRLKLLATELFAGGKSCQSQAERKTLYPSTIIMYLYLKLTPTLLLEKKMLLYLLILPEYFLNTRMNFWSNPEVAQEVEEHHAHCLPYWPLHCCYCCHLSWPTDSHCSHFHSHCRWNDQDWALGPDKLLRNKDSTDYKVLLSPFAFL